MDAMVSTTFTTNSMSLGRRKYKHQGAATLELPVFRELLTFVEKENSCGRPPIVYTLPSDAPFVWPFCELDAPVSSKDGRSASPVATAAGGDASGKDAALTAPAFVVQLKIAGGNLLASACSDQNECTSVRFTDKF